MAKFSLFVNIFQLFVPPAARGALFEKTAPRTPLQKLLFNFMVAKCKQNWYTNTSKKPGKTNN
jgi:hypothetical protein